MKKDWALSQADFDRLLRWLDADRDTAGREYQTIRERLIKIFAKRGADAEALADETINRVASKLEDIVGIYEGNPRFYFFSIANFVYREHLRRNGPPPDPPRPEFDEDKEHSLECLDRCLEKLSLKQRKLVLEYYAQDKSAKIDHRQRLADRLGITITALRIQACRIRSKLGACVKECQEEQPVQ